MSLITEMLDRQRRRDDSERRHAVYVGATINSARMPEGMFAGQDIRGWTQTWEEPSLNDGNYLRRPGKSISALGPARVAARGRSGTYWGQESQYVGSVTANTLNLGRPFPSEEILLDPDMAYEEVVSHLQDAINNNKLVLVPFASVNDFTDEYLLGHDNEGLGAYGTRLSQLFGDWATSIYVGFRFNWAAIASSTTALEYNFTPAVVPVLKRVGSRLDVEGERFNYATYHPITSWQNANSRPNGNFLSILNWANNAMGSVQTTEHAFRNLMDSLLTMWTSRPDGHDFNLFRPNWDSVQQAARFTRSILTSDSMMDELDVNWARMMYTVYMVAQLEVMQQVVGINDDERGELDGHLRSWAERFAMDPMEEPNEFRRSSFLRQREEFNALPEKLKTHWQSSRVFEAYDEDGQFQWKNEFPQDISLQNEEYWWCFEWDPERASELWRAPTQARVFVHNETGLLTFCAECGEYQWPQDVSWDEDRDEALCNRCNPWGNVDHITAILNYTFVPSPLVFHKLGKERPAPGAEEPLFLGMELEVCTSMGKNASAIEMHKKIEEAGLASEVNQGFFYFKQDASLSNGFEMVTHPFTPEWAKENFPFEMFQAAIDEDILYKKHNSAGQHIHVNKKAFTPSHMAKFLFAHERMDDFIAQVGGREKTANYANFDQYTNWSKKKGTKVGFAKRGSYHVGDPGRAAVNLSNDNTIELRYPSGDINPNAIRKNIQWVDAIFNFSRVLTVADLKEMHDPGFLIFWLQANKSKYPNLTQTVQRLIPTIRPPASMRNN